MLRSVLFAQTSVACGYTGVHIGSDGLPHFHDQNHVRVFNLDGSIKWDFETDSEDVKQNRNGTILAVSGHCDDHFDYECATHQPRSVSLYGLNGEDGSVLWHYKSDNSVNSHDFADVAVHDGTAYLVNECTRKLKDDGTEYWIGPAVEAIDTATSSLKWAKTFNLDCRSQEADNVKTMEVGKDGSLFLTNSRSIVVLRADNGEEKWRFEPGRQLLHRWTFAHDGSIFAVPRAYTPHADPKVDVFRLSGEDGSVLHNRSYETCGDLVWKMRAGDGHHLDGLSPVLGTNGVVYINALLGDDEACQLQPFHVLGQFDWARNTFHAPPAMEFRHSTRQRDDNTKEDIFVAISDTSGAGAGSGAGAAEVHAYTAGAGDAVPRLLWKTSFANISKFRYDVHERLQFGPDGTVFANDGYGFGFGPSGARLGSTLVIRNGEEIWKWDCDTFSCYYYAMAEDGTTYIATKENNAVARLLGLAAFSKEGTQKWVFNPDSVVTV